MVVDGFVCVYCFCEENFDYFDVLFCYCVWFEYFGEDGVCLILCCFLIEFVLDGELIGVCFNNCLLVVVIDVLFDEMELCYVVYC